MRKIQLFVLSVVVVLFTACHGNLWDAIDDLDSRVTKLEELCKEMNTNISALQTLVKVIQENDFITGIVPIEKGGEVIGYTITFGKHEPITIYNGEDGKDAQNGSATAPIIGVAKDADGIYYWTLNGEWLLDDEGNKLPVSGKNGNDGVDGEEGKDGQNGQEGKPGVDGKDGVTPQLKIENGYWYVSYDNGTTWVELGKAVGEDGEKGDKGDSMFISVTFDDENVYFILADGEVITIARVNILNDQINGYYKNREYVDLGLPSGTKWAKKNINGRYCFGGTESNVIVKDIYVNDKIIAVGDSICGTKYDIATLEWGEGWQTPTKKDFQELIQYCKVSFLSEEGLLLESTINKKTIFFQFSISPNADLGNTTIEYKWCGSYLSSTAYSGLYIEMSRYYDYYYPGYRENKIIQIRDITEISNIIASTFFIVRPVFKNRE